MSVWLLDTGPLVAFFDKSDRRHQWTVQQWRRAVWPLLTCEAVIAEAAYLLATHAGLPPHRLMAMLERKAISTSFDLAEHAGPVARLLEKYHDQGMQLADACLVRMSELHADCCVFTLDARDFTVYRRFERQVIPLLAPEP